jgi:hypothetical protein
MHTLTEDHIAALELIAETDPEEIWAHYLAAKLGIGELSFGVAEAKEILEDLDGQKDWDDGYILPRYAAKISAFELTEKGKRALEAHRAEAERASAERSRYADHMATAKAKGWSK